MSQRQDLTIDEILKDPMVQMLMRADHVDAPALEAELRLLGEARRRAATSSFACMKTRPRVMKAIGAACLAW